MSRQSVILVLVALMTIPTAAAGWGALGSYEPDTRADQTGGWMWQNATDSLSGNKVYFNSFLGEYPLTAVNPNAATAKSAFNAPVYAYWGMLGVWKDCNNDGFVGYGDQGLLEYRKELLTGQTNLCSEQSIPNTIPLDWMPPHNDGAWIHEFLPIVWRNVNNPAVPDSNPFNINDNDARVWMDENLPTDDLSKSGNAGGTCAINPQPVGTYRSTGGFLKYADCHTGFTITDGIDQAAAATGNPGGISFADAPRNQDHSGSSLNKANPWGTESDGTMVTVWDCDQGTTSVDVPLGAANQHDQHVTNVSQPTVPSATGSGSPAGTANWTASGTDRCRPNGDGNSHTANTLAHAPYANEGAATVNDVSAKTTTLNLQPIVVARPAAPLSLALGKGTPANLGVPLLGSNTLVAYSPGADGFWFTVPNVIAGPQFFNTTAYAYVSPSAVTNYHLDLKATSAGKYGSEACGTSTSGIKRGWQCASDLWYRDTNGNDIQPKQSVTSPTPAPYGARVGAQYNLRDTDCYDQSVTGARELGLTPSELAAIARQNGHELVPSVFGPSSTFTCAYST